MARSKFSAASLPDLHGKVFLVTGGNAGIGKATVAGLASRGARVYIGARSEQKAAAAIQEIQQIQQADPTAPACDIRFLEMDLARLASVVAAAKKLTAEEPALHGLINNAGIMATPFAMTEDGFESQFQINYLAHWLLTYHLLPLLQKTAALSPHGHPGTARIVNLSSQGHAMFAPKAGICFDDVGLAAASAMTRYGQSKLACVLHAKQLDTLYGGTKNGGGIWSAAVHPGVIHTDLLNKADGLSSWTMPSSVRRATTTLGRYLGLFDDAVQGAVSSLWAAASPEFPAAASGGYVVPYARLGVPSALAQDAQLAAALWTWTERVLREKGHLGE